MAASDTAVHEVHVPDIGDFSDVPVIDVMVASGDVIGLEDPLVTLESDKATMDVPAPVAGVVQDVKVRVGDKVSEGSLLITVAPQGGDGQAAVTSIAGPATAEQDGTEPDAPPQPARAPVPAEPPAPERAEPQPQGGPGAPEPRLQPGTGPSAAEAAAVGAAPAAVTGAGAAAGAPYASPAVRRLARELGVDLARVSGSGRKGRIIKQDVQSFSEPAAPPPAPIRSPSPPGADGEGLGLAPWPVVDFAKFGEVERLARTRIQKISAPNLARNWVRIPHVTHNDEADITDLEAFRRQTNEAYKQQGARVTMLAFLLTASVAALKEYPQFNASLDGDELVLKRYYHLGFAADTPQGLMVPVLRDVDRKGVLEIAREMGELSAKARDGKLKLAEMQGGTFTISSLGGIGGTSFTPIINAPEVAILGVTRSTTRPIWDGSAFVPRLMLPLSLSYDHRVIDGALAARFARFLVTRLEDMRRVLL